MDDVENNTNENINNNINTNSNNNPSAQTVDYSDMRTQSDHDTLNNLKIVSDSTQNQENTQTENKEMDKISENDQNEEDNLITSRKNNININTHAETLKSD